VLISNDNPRICDGGGFSRTARRDQPKAGVDAVERGSPGHLQPAINAQFTAGWGKDSVNLRPCHQRAGPDGASNAGLL
jgi:hypothetical protein